MNVVALYKTFSGPEFMEASLRGIFPWVNKVVCVHSNISWTGEEGNTVAPVVERLIQKNGSTWEDWIVNLYGDFKTQEEQYQFGIDWIHNNLEFELIMLIDTDEIWDDKNLELAFKKIKQYPDRDCFSTRLFSYVKSIFYRIDPIELCRPTVFLRPTVKKLQGARGWEQPNRALLHEVYFHHFTFVRFSEDDIRKKFLTSIAGDGEGAVGFSCDDWMDTKWKHLPYGELLHYQEQAKASWFRVKIVWKTELPLAILQDDTIMNFFSPPTGLTLEEDTKLYTYSQDRDFAVIIGHNTKGKATALSLGVDYVLELTPEAAVKDMNDVDQIDILFCSNLDTGYINKHMSDLYVGDRWQTKVKPGGYIIFDNYTPGTFMYDLLDRRLGVGNEFAGVSYPGINETLLITQRLAEW